MRPSLLRQCLDYVNTVTLLQRWLGDTDDLGYQAKMSTLCSLYRLRGSFRAVHGPFTVTVGDSKTPTRPGSWSTE